jgi:HK97 family phage major capsid protein
MDELEKLLAERAAVVTQWETLVSAGETRALSAEEDAKAEEFRATVSALDDRITAAEKARKEVATRAQRRAEELRAAKSVYEGRQTPQGFGIVTDLNDRKATRTRGLALRGWLLGERADDEQRAAMAEIRVHESQAIPLYRKAEIEERAAQTITTTGGGYAIMTGFLDRLEVRLQYYNPIRAIADVLVTAGGNPINFPTADDVSTVAADRTINTATSEDAVTFGQVALSAYGKSTELLIPYELAMDTALSDLEGRLAELMAERHGRKEQTDFTTGSGSSAPQGMVTGAGTGKTAASATAIAFDEIIDLEASLDPAYRQGAVMMMHQSIFSYLRKLKDSYGRYLIGEWNAAGSGSGYSILGYPVVFNSAMASTVATGNKTVLLCQPKKFLIRQAGVPDLIRDTSRFVREDQILLKMRQRYDSKVVQANAFKLLVQA